MIPNSEVWLCRNTRLKKDGEDTYYFSNETARRTFFLGKSANNLHFTELSYVRTDKTVTLPISYIEAAYCDYMMFTNTEYSGKTWYAFIDNVKYINDAMTEIAFTIDPVQTWLPSMTLGNSNYIERETVASDSYGEHLLDEGIGGGDLYMYKSTDIIKPGTETINILNSTAGKVFVVAVKRLPVPGAWNSEHTAFNSTSYFGSLKGITDAVITNTTYKPSFWQSGLTNQPLAILEAPLSLKNQNLSTLFYVLFYGTRNSVSERLERFLRMYTGEVKDENDVAVLSSDDVVGIFSCPGLALPSGAKSCIDHAYRNSKYNFAVILGGAGFADYTATPQTEDYWNGGETTDYYFNESYNVGYASFEKGVHIIDKKISIDIDKITTNNMFNGYKPRNKKCLQYPFVQVTVDGMNGDAEDFKPELFEIDPVVGISSMIIGASAHTYVRTLGYNNEDAFLHLHEMQSYPTYQWNTNSFSEWYGLHGSQMNNQLIRSTLSDSLSIVSSSMSGSPTGVFNSALSATGKAQDYLYTLSQATAVTPKSHGTNSGNEMVRSFDRDYGLIAYYCSHDDDVRSADAYFTQFGYKVNRIGTINLTSRTRFNYVKTIGFQCTAQGNVPTTAFSELEARFTSGLRFWHGDYIGDYVTANNIR